MSTVIYDAAEQPSIPLAALSEVDRRICPLDNMIDWQSPALDLRELATLNHVHGIVGDFITGPEEVKIAIGIRTLGELEAFDKASRHAVKEETARRSSTGDVPFAVAVGDKERELSQGLDTLIENLMFEGRNGEIVPEIVKHYTVDFDYPEGVVEDLEALELEHAVSKHAVRKGLASTLRFVLGAHLDSLITGRTFSSTSPEATLEVYGDEEEIEGHLTGLHRDFDGDDWLELDVEGGRRRVKQGRVKTLGVTVAPQGVEAPQNEGAATEPTSTGQSKRRIFRP